MTGGYDRGAYALLGLTPPDRRPLSPLLAAAFAPTGAAGELVAAGLSPNAPAAIPDSACAHCAPGTRGGPDAGAPQNAPASLSIEAAGGADAARQPIGAAGLDPATELTIAATLYLMRAPDTETARRRLRAAVDALPIPLAASVAGMVPQLVEFRVAAEMVLRAFRSPIGMRAAEAVLDRTLGAYCAAVRARCGADGGERAA